MKVPSLNGSFLEVFSLNFSAIALAWNLHTGFVSPQYHDVFDYKLRPSFTMGRPLLSLTTSAIIFCQYCECYVKEQFNKDGIHVYDPPLLNEVWLPEEERCDCAHLLDKQHTHHATHECELETYELKHCLEHLHLDLPDLAASDVNSDYGSLPDNDPDFKPG